MYSMYDIKEEYKKMSKIYIQDPKSGILDQTFRTPYTLQHRIGGFVPVRFLFEGLAKSPQINT